jgi:polyisoprenyl-phosphate glycosyltransferase
MTTVQQFSLPELSIVIPVYRSADCLETLIEVIDESMRPTGKQYEVILVNDFSPDESWKVIKSLCERRSNIVGVDLRRNFGQDNAIMVGLRLARGRYIAIMDDDLQHHPKYLPALIAKIEETEADVVYADYREKKQKLWKRIGSYIHGKIAEWVIYKPKEIYLSPYKLIRKEVADLMCSYCGPKPHIDGLLLQFTFRLTQIPVKHHARYSGESTYSFWRSAAVASRLAFSFSVRPVRLVSWIGLILAALASIFIVIVVGYRLLFPEAFTPYAAGWASLMTVILLVAGIQMIFFGILGEYAGRAHLNLNNQPQTSVRQVLNRDNPISYLSGSQPNVSDKRGISDSVYKKVLQ